MNPLLILPALLIPSFPAEPQEAAPTVGLVAETEKTSPGEAGDDELPARSATSGSETAQWLGWRGPGRDGQVPGTDWPQGLSEENLTLAWRVPDLGPSYAGPLIVGDRVISVETLDKELEVVRAFDRTTGKPLWDSEWEGAMQVPFFAARNGSWIRSTPASDGERVYVAGIRDVLVCLDVETGDLLWSYDFMQEHDSPLPKFGFVCSPLIQGDHVYVQAGGGLAKLDKLTGELVWMSLEGSSGAGDSDFSSPALAELNGVQQLLVQTRSELCGVEPARGDVLWRRPIRAFRGMNILTPTVIEGQVFTSAYGGRSQLLDVSLDDGTWATEQLWDTGAQGYMTSPVVIDGHAYLFLRSNRFTCIRISDGESTWTSAPTGDEYWSLLAQGDRILALTHDGELLLVQANPEEYTELGRVQVSDQETWAHVSYAAGTVFVREQEALSAWTWK